VKACRAPRGTRDILPSDAPTWRRVVDIARDLGDRYGYRPLETPLFEQSVVFERAVGETSDVVEKELFRVQARNDEGEAWALRPEATAGIVRAYIQHGMHAWHQPVKVALTGPMFRYDRPQAGRYRQFWQWDVEAIGDAGPAIDAEIVELGARFYGEVGLADVEVRLNSIGDAACRPAYVARLVEHFGGHEASLPPTERRRLETNPLRLLDSKDPAMAPLIATAPTIADHLCDECAGHLGAVRAHIESLGVRYRIDTSIVRGLDYYTRTAFEYFVPGREGQQQALGGGGRYDGLAELLGGRPTPGIGFALGLDRVVLALEESGGDPAPSDGPLAVVVGADPDDTVARLTLATELRAEGLAIVAELARRKLGRQLESAVRQDAHFAVIVGDELADGNVQLRDLRAGTQRVVPLGDLPAHLRRAEARHRHGGDPR
jgi:histidyl-tRNA synthetase